MNANVEILYKYICVCILLREKKAPETIWQISVLAHGIVRFFVVFVHVACKKKTTDILCVEEAIDDCVV